VGFSWVRRAIRRGSELVRGASPADGELKAQIPWLRVFVEGVVIVGKLETSRVRLLCR